MAKELYKKLKLLREQSGFSQEQLADELGISRPTYMQIEKGERELTISEAKKLASIFSLNLESFLENNSSPMQEVILESGAKNEKESDIRIVMTRANVKKFREVLLYVLSKVGAKPNVGETALYKLLYFIDFDFYEKFDEQKKYLPRREPDLKSLSAQEIKHIDEVLARLSDKNAIELSDYSHNDVPWKVHKSGEIISYESVFYRDQEHSVRNYEDEL